MRILALDRGSQHIGLARRSSETKITFPLGYLTNDATMIATLAGYITSYAIDTIVYGFVHTKRLRRELETARTQLTVSFPTLQRYGCNESYTTVQADVLLGSTTHPAQDALAAMYILDHFLEQEK